MNPHENDLTLRFGDLLEALWRHLWTVVLVIITCLGVAIGVGLMQQPQYEASMKMLIKQNRDVGDNVMDAASSQRLAQTMTVALESRPVAEEVIRLENLDTSPREFLEEDLDVEQLPETQFIQVGYRNPDPEKAQKVANTIGEVFPERAVDLQGSGSGVGVTVWEPAALPENPVTPNLLRNGILALLVGSILSVGVVFLLERLDLRWRSPEDAERASGVPTFGVVPEFEPLKGETKKQKVRNVPF